MSRNRIRSWNNVSFTIPADAGQVPADPSCEKMWETPDGKRPGKIKPTDKKIVQPLADGFQGPIDTRMDWNEFRKKHEKDSERHYLIFDKKIGENRQTYKALCNNNLTISQNLDEFVKKINEKYYSN